MRFVCITNALDVLWWPTTPPFMLTTTISELFGSAAVFYGLLLPVFTAILLCLLLIPAFLKGARIVESGRAAYCVLAEGFGILLMAFGGLPTLASVLARVSLPPMTYASLLFTFVVGGLVFLRHDHLLHRLDPAARLIPQTIALYTWRAVGLLLSMLGFLYLLIFVLMTQGATPATNWWALPCTILLFGLLLLWATSHDHGAPAFVKIPLHKKSAPAAKKAGNRKR